ncbi:DUF4296 domain-containing protein [Euzebyella marina]|uniref:DUF4296 domain-containing protein n=1 Tax=Euzebyella marina TaxID=1761453 RepID=A0A3G2LAY1_9FLAO|nr:DUF4296 domain-containing protein [Euzebyella marina]AYN69407.1 DUF4296 domain-containing protein [Euzebyella marina]
MAIKLKIVLFCSVVLLCACNDQLIEPPENLIGKDKMVLILKDVAIINAAKTTNVSVLRENNVDIMEYIYAKYDVDSLQFVESDKYYASLPAEYKTMYLNVEALLEKDQNVFKEAKEVQDSIKRIELERKQEEAQRVKDSLREISESKTK